VRYEWPCPGTCCTLERVEQPAAKVELLGWL
jgi:hypothetical protein